MWNFCSQGVHSRGPNTSSTGQRRSSLPAGLERPIRKRCCYREDFKGRPSPSTNRLARWWGGGGAGDPRHHPSAVPVRQAMHVVAELPRWGEAPSRWSSFVTAGRSFLVRRRFFHALLLIPALHTQGAPFLGFNPSSTGPSACFFDVCKRMQKALC